MESHTERYLVKHFGAWMKRRVMNGVEVKHWKKRSNKEIHQASLKLLINLTRTIFHCFARDLSRLFFLRSDRFRCAGVDCKSPAAMRERKSVDVVGRIEN